MNFLANNWRVAAAIVSLIAFAVSGSATVPNW
jgi:hypothetical protein